MLHIILLSAEYIHMVALKNQSSTSCKFFVYNNVTLPEQILSMKYIILTLFIPLVL